MYTYDDLVEFSNMRWLGPVPFHLLLLVRRIANRWLAFCPAAKGIGAFALRSDRDLAEAGQPDLNQSRAHRGVLNSSNFSVSNA